MISNIREASVLDFTDAWSHSLHYLMSGIVVLFTQTYTLNFGDFYYSLIWKQYLNQNLFKTYLCKLKTIGRVNADEQRRPTNLRQCHPVPGALEVQVGPMPLLVQVSTNQNHIPVTCLRWNTLAFSFCVIYYYWEKKTN